MAPASVPTLEIEGPSGRRVVVAPRSAEDRVGDLADVLGVDPAGDVAVDGRRVGRHESLRRAGIVRGSRLGHDDGTVAGERSGAPVVTVVAEAGPAAGVATELPPGRHVIGRSATAAVQLDDLRVEPHHVLLDVGDDGAVAVMQLTGRVPCRLDDQPIDGPSAAVDGSVLAVGTSRLRIAAGASTSGGVAMTASATGDPWRRVLRRPPRVVPTWDPVPIEVPVGPATASRAGAAGLLAAILTALGAAVVAVVMGSAMFLIFAAVGLVASIGVAIAARVGAARDGRRSRAGRAREVAAFAAAVHAQREARWRHHLATTPTIAAAVTAATTVRADLWARRPTHGDAHRVSIGWGAEQWTVSLAGDGHSSPGADVAAVIASAGRFDDAPLGCDLGPGAALAISGPGAVAAARSLVVQLATWVGPADLRIVAVAADPTDWEWCRWLPHAAGAAGSLVIAADEHETLVSVLGGLDDGNRRHVVVVTDRADLLTQRTGAVRRFLAAAPSAAVIAVVGSDGSPPAMCRSVLEIGSIGLGRWWADASAEAHPETVHVAGATSAVAASVGRVLAGLRDPEDGSSSSGPAGSCGIGELMLCHGPGPIDDPIGIAAGWRAGGADPPPVAVLGVAADGVVEIDLARDGPHALVAGTTGSGKSELLRTFVASLAARCSPDHLTFVLVDYKGGSTFDACADLPHTVGLVTDLDDRLAERALTSLDAEVRRRERVLRTSGSADLADHLAISPSATSGEPVPRLVVVIDEFATLAAELPGFLHALVGIAQRGRSLGVHLVLATQRPAGVVDDDIRANTNLRIALRLQDVADARDVVGVDGPASFPRGAPGRAVLRLDQDEHVVFQVARSTGPAATDHEDRLHVVGDVVTAGAGESELTVLVRSIRNAAALSDVAAPHRPWLPPLPARLEPGEVPAGAVGLLDDPRGQCRRLLRWNPSDGNLAICGAVGTGTTTALLSVLTALASSRSPTAFHCYVVDACGDERLDGMRAVDHCGAVIRPHERERLRRLLTRLTAELDGRRAGGQAGSRPGVALAIDGLPALRTVLDDPLDHDALDLLTRIVAEGPGVGLVTVFTAERPGAVPAAMLASCAERWIGHLDDSAEAVVCGLPGALVPAGGPGRFVVATSRLTGQLAELGPSLVAVGRHDGGPPPVGVLPEVVEVPARGSVAGGGLALTVGLGFDRLVPAELHVTDGEHVLVAGPARSGRTTALVVLVRSWRVAHPSGTVRVVTPRARGPWPGDEVVTVDAALAALSALGGTGPSLLVIDDAERVDDARLGPLAAERRPGLLIAAAGRPDALRPLYGHWTGVVRRSRIGVLLAGCADIDGDLLGELLPRRPPVAPRPGLAWLIDATGRRLAQLTS